MRPSWCYSTYLGDFGAESATSLAVDGAGNAYVTGFTTSSAFPVAPNAFQTTLAGGQDGFIVKINADDVKTSEPYSFPVNGGAVTATAGQTSQPLFGYMAADVITGLSPSGLEIIDLRSAGTLINEVSVPVPALTYTARFYVSTSPRQRHSRHDRESQRLRGLDWLLFHCGGGWNKQFRLIQAGAAPADFRLSLHGTVFPAYRS